MEAFNIETLKKWLKGVLIAQVLVTGLSVLAADKGGFDHPPETSCSVQLHRGELLEEAALPIEPEQVVEFIAQYAQRSQETSIDASEEHLLLAEIKAQKDVESQSNELATRLSVITKLFLIMVTEALIEKVRKEVELSTRRETIEVIMESLANPSQRSRMNGVILREIQQQLTVKFDDERYKNALRYFSFSGGGPRDNRVSQAAIDFFKVNSDVTHLRQALLLGLDGWDKYHVPARDLRKSQDGAIRSSQKPLKLFLMGHKTPSMKLSIASHLAILGGIVASSFTQSIDMLVLLFPYVGTLAIPSTTWLGRLPEVPSRLLWTGVNRTLQVAASAGIMQKGYRAWRKTMTSFEQHALETTDTGSNSALMAKIADLSQMERRGDREFAFGVTRDFVGDIDKLALETDWPIQVDSEAFGLARRQAVSSPPSLEETLRIKGEISNLRQTSDEVSRLQFLQWDYDADSVFADLVSLFDQSKAEENGAQYLNHIRAAGGRLKEILDDQVNVYRVLALSHLSLARAVHILDESVKRNGFLKEDARLNKPEDYVTWYTVFANRYAILIKKIQILESYLDAANGLMSARDVSVAIQVFKDLQEARRADSEIVVENLVDEQDQSTETSAANRHQLQQSRITKY